MLTEAGRLHAMGFAVHWLKPSSKLPLESGWTKGPRKTWAQLEDSYQYGLNVGVRLGVASNVGGRSLSVIDCDVKSTDPKHIAEMEKALARLMPGYATAPQVASGRGNGSRHLYVTTPVALAQGYRFAQSPEKVRVVMPSAKPSRVEKETLTPTDLEEGVRLRAAWEISVMGEGQQVVLPPSVHPDTGGAYEWVQRVERPADLPHMAAAAGAAKKAAPAGVDFAAVAVDLVGSELSSHVVDLIISGKDCADRSAGLYLAAIAMLKARFQDNEILSVLTDKDTFLGAAAYDHANTTSRARAAEWVRKYTLTKARAETSAEAAFASEAVTVALDPAGVAAQSGDMAGPWEQDLERVGGKPDGRPQPTMLNVLKILRGAESSRVFVRDDFAGREQYGHATAWGGVAGAEIRDIDVTHIKAWLAAQWRMEPGSDKIHEAIAKIAADNRFHPVREYLDALEWDGVARLDSWLVEFMDAEGPAEYLAAVSRKVLCAMVARVYEPGVKFDHVLIMEGPQGFGKSTALRILAGDAWFTDAALDLKNKDTALSLRSKWVYELGELAGMHRSDVASLKAFITTQSDYLRAPYGRRAENYPRQCVFIGTTNDHEYLKDATGNRRFWPVKVGRCMFGALTRVRDQLFAEARFAWELGEPLYLESAAAQLGAASEQSARVHEDILVDTLRKKLADPDPNFEVPFTLAELFYDFGPLADIKAGYIEQRRAADALRILGYEKYRGRDADGSLRYFWKPKSSMTVVEQTMTKKSHRTPKSITPAHI